MALDKNTSITLAFLQQGQTQNWLKGASEQASAMCTPVFRHTDRHTCTQAKNYKIRTSILSARKFAHL